MFNLNPKEEKFYKMFCEQATNVYNSALVLGEAINDLKNKENVAKKLEKLEQEGEDILSKVIKELNTAFITPIDREDIYAISKSLESITDLIGGTMHRFTMFDINESNVQAENLCSMIVNVTKEIMELMNEMKLLDKKNNIPTKIKNIKNIELNGDKLFRKTVTELFKNEKDVLTIIKWKEIYQMLEDTLDSCENVANIVEGVVMKHA